MTMRIVHQRVDALTLAFRARLSPVFLDALEGAAAEAKEHHSEAALEHGAIVGAINYSHSDKAWLVTNKLYRSRFLTKGAPGRVKRDDGSEEAGWTTEVVWSAQALAAIGATGAVEHTRAALATVAEIHEDPRLRRFDLCTDVAGVVPTREMAERLAKAARCEHHDYPFDEERVAEEVEAGANVYWLREVTGFRAGHGDVVLRVYDKREHLKALPPEVRAAEEERWREGGWDGEEPVMRIELQLRGQVVAELGARNAARPFDPATGEVFSLEELFDRVWRRMIRVAPEGRARGFRLTAEGYEDEERMTRRPTDELWAIAREAQFSERRHVGEHARVRVRGGSSVEQATGCDLSMLAAAGQLAKADDVRRRRHVEPDRAEELLRREMRKIARASADFRTAYFVKRWGPVKAYEHVGVIRNAKVARFTDPREVLAALIARGMPPPEAVERVAAA